MNAFMRYKGKVISEKEEHFIGCSQKSFINIVQKCMTNEMTVIFNEFT